MKTKVNICDFCFTSAGKDYFKDRPVEHYEQYLTDLETCIEDAFEIDFLEEPIPSKEKGRVTFATGGINWASVADMMNELSQPFFEGIEFV